MVIIVELGGVSSCLLLAVLLLFLLLHLLAIAHLIAYFLHVLVWILLLFLHVVHLLRSDHLLLLKHLLLLVGSSILCICHLVLLLIAFRSVLNYMCILAHVHRHVASSVWHAISWWWNVKSLIPVVKRRTLKTKSCQQMFKIITENRLSSLAN